MDSEQTIGPTEIWQLTETVWSSILNLDLAEGPAETSDRSGIKVMTSCVQITGAWDGAVVVRCTEDLAKRCASAMFSTDSTTPAEVRDALGEIVNMIGGNVKSLLPGPSKLSLPAIAEGIDYQMSVPGTRVMSEVNFRSQGQPMQVTVLVRND